MSSSSARIAPSPDVPETTRSDRRPLWFGIFITVVLIGATFGLAYYQASASRKTMETEILQLHRNICTERTSTADVWVLSMVEQIKRLVGSDIFQLFASEVDKLPDGIPLLFAPKESDSATPQGNAAQLSAQLPLMRTLLSDFIANAKFSEARIVNTSGDPYISTQAAMLPLSISQKQFVAHVVRTGEMLYSPLEARQEGIVFDLFVPIMPPQYEKQNNRPVAVIVVTQAAGQQLASFLAPVVGDASQRVCLVQRTGDVFQVVVPGMTTLRDVGHFPLDDSGGLEFSLRRSFIGDTDVYSSGFRLRVLNWWIVVET